MRDLVSAVCGIWIGIAAPVLAEPVVVLELYTSQGCSSCPPADDLVAILTSDPRIIALSLHVDYWDYIGWADSFAHSAFTARQKAYAHAIGSSTIYTPQLIIGGQDRIEGYSPEATAASLQQHLSATPSVVLVVDRQGSVLAISAESEQPLAAPVLVQLVRYIPEEKVAIKRGENAGKTITYHNIVTSWEVVGEWDGTSPLNLTAAFAGDGPGVVILQTNGPSAILAAARVN